MDELPSFQAMLDWIDENDTNTWAALKVWIKDDSGRDELLTLKEADEGYIPWRSRNRVFYIF